MALTISLPVGMYGKGRPCPNRVDDQHAVIVLLNQVPESEGGTNSGGAKLPDDRKLLRAGAASDGLLFAIANFQAVQQQKGNLRTSDGHIDPKGPSLRLLNDLAAKTPAQPDTSLAADSPYLKLPAPVLETLRRSYRERNETNFNLTNGFDWDKPQASGKKMLPADRTFTQVLDAIGQSALDIVAKVYNTVNSLLPDFWPHVHTIRKIWGGTSEGFTFNTKDRSALAGLMNCTSRFCADFALFQSDHQTNEGRPCPRQCYRQIMAALGPGLHVCVVESGKEDGAGGPHEIHIDFHQIATFKVATGKCFYSYILDHAQDVGPHIILDLVLPKLLEILHREPKVWEPGGRELIEKLLKAELAELAAYIRGIPGGEEKVNEVVNKLVALVSLYMDALNNRLGPNPLPCGQ